MQTMKHQLERIFEGIKANKIKEPTSAPTIDTAQPPVP